MGLQEFLVDARFEVEALERSVRSHFDQVLEACGILTKQCQMVAGFTFSACSAAALGAPVAGGDVGFVADDRVDVLGFASVVELKRAVQIAVIGQRKGVHTVVGGALDQFGDGTRAVQQAVVTVAVKMDKRALRHEELISLGC